jgi:hypothetical protein
MGHKGPVLRPRCIGPARARTQVLINPPVAVMRGVVDQHSNSLLFEDVQFGHMGSGLITEHKFWLQKVSNFKL